MRAETEPWWRQAQADLDTADALLAAARFYAVSWFAHQAVEKAFKALIIEGGGVRPRTHDILYLAAANTLPASLQADADLLDPLFDLVRYPDVTGIAPVDVFTGTDAEQHLTSARRLVTWVNDRL